MKIDEKLQRSSKNFVETAVQLNQFSVIVEQYSSGSRFCRRNRISLFLIFSSLYHYLYLILDSVQYSYTLNQRPGMLTTLPKWLPFSYSFEITVLPVGGLKVRRADLFEQCSITALCCSDAASWWHVRLSRCFAKAAFAPFLFSNSNF